LRARDMANLRVFVSSTCYDLGAIRSQLKALLEQLGFDPVLSEYKDVLFDPRVHTHTSCVEEVMTVDVVILLLGGRFGGRAVPQAISAVDVDAVSKSSKSMELLKAKENLSVTQLEVLKAIENRIPVFAFVDDRVMHDHATYEKNKSKAIISELEFASIEKIETAKFIFEFINFLRHRSSNNAIITFSSFSDLENAIKRQFSGLFQRLLSEARRRNDESSRINNLSDQLEALKAAVLTAVGSDNEKKVARAVVRFRRLVEFLREFGSDQLERLVREGGDFVKNGLMPALGVSSVLEVPLDVAKKLPLKNASIYRDTFIYFMQDGRVYTSRFGPNFLALEDDWKEFFQLPQATREVVFSTLNEMYPSPTGRFVRLESISQKDLENMLQLVMSGRDGLEQASSRRNPEDDGVAYE
jgi:hypothetical protein